MDCWHRELDHASTEAEVARHAREYLALWAPRELESLTLGWRPVRVEDAADVERVKAWLLDSPGIADPTTELHGLAGYFWHASSRIEKIRRVHT